MKQEAAPEGLCLLLGWAEIAQTFNRTHGFLELFSPSRTTYMAHFLLQESCVFQIPAQTDTSCNHRQWDAVCWASALHCFSLWGHSVQNLSEQAGDWFWPSYRSLPSYITGNTRSWQTWKLKYCEAQDGRQQAQHWNLEALSAIKRQKNRAPEKHETRTQTKVLPNTPKPS